MLKVNGEEEGGGATVQQLCYGSAAVSSRYARRDLRYAFTELLHGVDVCLILDQFGELITCPIQEGDGAVVGKSISHVTASVASAHDAGRRARR
jgi:hypothetical protein